MPNPLRQAETNVTVGILDNSLNDTVQHQNIGDGEEEDKEEKDGDDHDDIEKLSFRMSLENKIWSLGSKLCW